MNYMQSPEENTLTAIKPRLTILPFSMQTIQLQANESIRFEDNKRCRLVQPADILFVKSADHYVKSFVRYGREKKWMSRHCSLKELLDLLPPDDFVRLNKFYLLNLNHFSHIDESKKVLFFNDGFSLPIPHRISPYLRHLLNTPCT
jgi:DNA-binding LytR/AlgR family response regulator